MKTLLSPASFRTLPEKIALHSGASALAIGAAYLLAFAVTDHAVWSGPAGFRKPAVFGFSVGLTLLSLGWLMRFFPSRPRLHAALVTTMSGALLLEIGIIALQQMRGVPSHFNMATAFDGALWSMMGLAINIFALLAFILAALSFGRLNAPPALRAAIRAAMLLLVFSQISGMSIVFHGSTVVLQGGEFIAANISRAATFGAAGNLKLPHAIALHGLQVLPLLGALVTRSSRNTRPGRFPVILSGAGFFGLAATAQFQAYAGRSLTDLDPTFALAFAASLLAWIAPWAYAVSAALSHAYSRRSSTPAGTLVG